MSDGMLTLKLLLVLIVLSAVNFVPAAVAYWRGHRHALAIFALVFFLGWTGWFWIAAMIWALTPPKAAGTS